MTILYWILASWLAFNVLFVVWRTSRAVLRAREVSRFAQLRLQAQSVQYQCGLQAD